MNKYLQNFIVAFLVIGFFEYIFEYNLVLGNFRFTPVIALVVLSVLVTLVWTTGKDLIMEKLPKMKEYHTDFFYEAGLLSAIFWVAARFPDYTGFGISKFCWAIFLGLAVASFSKFVSEFSK